MTAFYQVVREYKYDGEAHETFAETEAEAIAYVHAYDISNTSADLVIFECGFVKEQKRRELHRFTEVTVQKHTCDCTRCNSVVEIPHRPVCTS